MLTDGVWVNVQQSSFQQRRCVCVHICLYVYIYIYKYIYINVADIRCVAHNLQMIVKYTLFLL